MRNWWLCTACFFLVTGCSVSEPDTYVVNIFQGEGEDWSAELHVIEYADPERKPKDRVLLSANENLTAPVEVSFADTDVREMVELENGEGEVLLEGLETLLRKKQAGVDMLIRWEGGEETIRLTYETQVRGDARFLPGD
ncbi:hypothetical protein [Desmospora profundinema]|uniref:Uncharacterized protein n=1 Tax=Desmospora profundinema TaxID=1571184 RepID=A0ABU1IRH1_9BACL|nr:hypothetical protein [Desmospora profundinema]MDR6227389.1 hypothetical protein [Desmospora profundinema]